MFADINAPSLLVDCVLANTTVGSDVRSSVAISRARGTKKNIPKLFAQIVSIAFVFLFSLSMNDEIIASVHFKGVSELPYVSPPTKEEAL